MDKLRREITGSFYTPQIWVELSQKYLTDVLGEDWQEEYYVWDCAAGTGNLLAGLTNKYNIWASTLDKQDVEVMRDRIKNGANLLEDHVFQFDFLNDEFSKLPKPLFDILNNSEKRKKLVIYINPPYAEASDGIGLGGRKVDVSKETKIYAKYGEILKKAKNELFAQFIVRIYKEINGATIANFSTLKILQSSNFVNFRQFFAANLLKCFIVPANTFDNVKGKFTIGFMIWNTLQNDCFTNILAEIYNEKALLLGTKNIFAPEKKDYINNWIKIYANNANNSVGYLVYSGNDFQHIGEIRISSTIPISHVSTIALNKNNLIQCCVYLSVRHCIKATWLNDRDQFLYPNANWEADIDFQNDCLAFALFHGQNKISAKVATNHWIPFTENEVNSREKFESNFMSKFIKGKTKANGNGNLLENEKERTTELKFSPSAKAVFSAAQELWKYYHTKPNCNVNASLYDIREYFQKRNTKGKMNNKSDDETYMKLIIELKNKLKILAQKIEPKIYAYEFLKE